MHARHALLLGLALAAPSLQAQSVVVGEVGVPDLVAKSQPPGGMTVIDLLHPANASGTVTTATVASNGEASCEGLRLRFYRSSGAGMAMIAERGPFPARAAGLKTLDLVPPVAVQQGDLIGVYSPPCASIGLSSGGPNETILQTNTNYEGGPFPADSTLPRAVRLSARASSALFTLAGVVPAVGATAGANGAAFRTTIQVHNPSDATIRPQLVFHPAGQSAGASDPSLSVTLDAHATAVLELADAFHLTGLGSLDVLTSADPPPAISARVYNDTGHGTNGFNEPVIPPSAALHAGESGAIIFPSDPETYRMNIGVRTLSGGAKLTVSATDLAGHTLGPAFTKTYPPDYFEQTPIDTFLGFVAVRANGSALLQVTGGDAIVYVSTTDNRTNDSAIAIVQRR